MLSWNMTAQEDHMSQSKVSKHNFNIHRRLASIYIIKLITVNDFRLHEEVCKR